MSNEKCTAVSRQIKNWTSIKGDRIEKRQKSQIMWRVAKAKTCFLGTSLIFVIEKSLDNWPKKIQRGKIIDILWAAFFALRCHLKNNSKWEITVQKRPKMSRDTLVDPFPSTCVIWWHCRKPPCPPSSVSRIIWMARKVLFEAFLYLQFLFAVMAKDNRLKCCS